VIGGVPSSYCEGIVTLLPLTVLTSFAWREGPYFAFAVVVAAGLDEGAVGDGATRGTPDVGLDEEGAEGVGCDVVFDGVSGAVCFENLFGEIVAARTVGESEVGKAEVGAVEDDDTVIVEELHVHGDDAYGLV